jgi:hypothetical protein
LGILDSNSNGTITGIKDHNVPNLYIPLALALSSSLPSPHSRSRSIERSTSDQLFVLKSDNGVRCERFERKEKEKEKEWSMGLAKGSIGALPFALA